MGNISLINGILIPNQNPLDSKTICLSETVLKNLGTNNNLAYTYYDGLQVLCQLEKTEWEWREALEGEVGLLTTNFTYPAGIIVNGITYSLKQYNFFLLENLQFDNDIAPATVTVGGITPNTILAGKTIKEILTQMLVVYLNPAFTSASTTYATPVEVGTTISGNVTFNWTITNSSNVKDDSLSIFDINTSTSILSNFRVYGGAIVTVNNSILNTLDATQSWKIRALNTKTEQGELFESNIITVTAKYKRFFGASSITPTTSAQVRALPSNNFDISTTNPFYLNTGNTEKKWVIALPFPKTIISATNETALGSVVTYLLLGTIQVNDAGGTPRTYNLYEMNLGAPYSVNQVHKITTS